jgi:CDP-glucose 4,6-dehydratase
MNGKDAFWRDRRVFVTGCTGLLGASLTQSLVDVGAHVVGLVRDRVHASELWNTSLRRKL